MWDTKEEGATSRELGPMTKRLMHGEAIRAGTMSAEHRHSMGWLVDRHR